MSNWKFRNISQGFYALSYHASELKLETFNQ